ncbi:MAG TPA: phosphatase PAP2 family protein [Jiangellaceae bacterium]
MATETRIYHKSRQGPVERPVSRSGWKVAAREAALIGVAALLYSLVRGLTNDRVEAAFANSERVISFERRLGLFVETDLQSFALRSDVVLAIVNAIYIAYWPLVFGTLAWLLVRRPRIYPLFRNAILASGALSLVVFALFPLAPPRFVPEYGFVDTIARESAGYRSFNASPLVNEYAAMPSLHFGWVLLLAIAVATVVLNPYVRAVAFAVPPLMFAAIVLTGNHYVVDGFAGGAIVLTGLWMAVALRKRRTNRILPERGLPESFARPTDTDMHAKDPHYPYP